jgi:hypothetical protein
MELFCAVMPTAKVARERRLWKRMFEGVDGEMVCIC